MRPVLATLASCTAALAALIVSPASAQAAGGVLQFSGNNALVAPVIGANLAPGGTVIDFSSQFDTVTYSANHVIDNNPSTGNFYDLPGTFWLTSHPPVLPQFVTVDLGSVQSIGRITLFPTINQSGSPKAAVNQFRL